jgi:ornithine cyclodeaminase
LTEPTPLVHPGSVKPSRLTIPYGTVSAVTPDLLDVMDKVVVDDWREAQSGRFGRFGALCYHVDSGILSEQTLYGQIGDIAAGPKPGRENDDERIPCWHRTVHPGRRTGLRRP